MKKRKGLNTAEAAEYIGLSQSTLEKDRLQNSPLNLKIPFYQVGRRILYDTADIDKWLATLRRNVTQ